MPCEIASFSVNEKYDMTLFFINFYICLIIIITVLIFANTIYNYYVYNNIVSEKIYNDTNVIENGTLPPKASELSQENKILIGETVDYKLFISLLIDQNMYYNDKYFTLNITNILLDGFMLATIVLVIFSIIYGGTSLVKPLARYIRLNLNISELKEYIIQYCYFINNSSCEGVHTPKMFSIFLIFAILLAIYALRRSGSHSINYADYLNFEKSKYAKNSEPKNIENMLNIICDENNDFLNSNSNITKIMNKLNGHNIHTVSIINTNDTNDNTVLEAAKKALDDAKKASDAVKIADATKALDEANEVVTINKFITKIKTISAIIKNNNKDDTDNKDLDFVKLVIVYLNNKKIYNDNISSEKIPNFDLGRTYAQSLLNIITYVIPFSNNLFGKFKTNNYDIENILIGAVPLLDRLKISIPEDKCPINEYASSDEFNKITEQKKCYYNNYIFKLKETRAKLKQGLNDILIAFILSTIAIIVLFYYIYINYNFDNMRWAKMAAIKMLRLSKYNPLNLFSILFGNIMFQLNNNNM
jgi:hypothetical protein